MSVPPEAREAAAALGALPGVRAVAMGGSRAAGTADEGSDVDLYALGAPPPEDARRAALAPLAAPGSLSLGETWFEPTDGWRASGGLSLEAMWWDPDWIASEVADALERHRPRLGYSTALAFTAARWVPLHDPEGIAADLTARASVPYPDALARAILAHNLPMLTGARCAFGRQIAEAERRGDAVALNHRVAAFLASAFDVLFALHRRLHPGEKRLTAHARALPPSPGLAETLDLIEAFARAPLHPGDRPNRIADLLRAMAADRA